MAAVLLQAVSLTAPGRRSRERAARRNRDQNFASPQHFRFPCSDSTCVSRTTPTPTTALPHSDTMADQICYSAKYFDDENEYR